MWDTLCCVTGALEVSMRHKSTKAQKHNKCKFCNSLKTQFIQLNATPATCQSVPISSLHWETEFLPSGAGGGGRAGVEERTKPGHKYSTQPHTDQCLLFDIMLKPLLYETSHHSLIYALYEINLGHTFAFTSNCSCSVVH